MRSIKSIVNTGFRKYLSILFIVALAISCKNSTDVIQPSVTYVPAGFSVLPGGLNPDFYASNKTMAFYSILQAKSLCDTFRAKLSDKVTWNVDLLGLTSGAVQRISGTSDSVEAIWCGGNDGLYFFKRGEKVQATLSFYGTDLKLMDTITISGTKIYNDVQGTNGVIVSDCEGTYATLPANPGNWYNFHDPTGSGSPTGPDQEQIFNGIDTTMNAVQGYGYYLLDGVDRASLNNAYSTFFIEGAGFELNNYLLSTLPNVDPENLYFNIYVYSFGLPNTKLQIGFDEDDNSDKKWDPYKEDEVVYVVRTDWVGWKLITFKYTDAKFSNVDPKSGAHGNHIHEPNKITKMGFVMNTDPALFHAKVAFDFPCFTVGHPFNPNH